MHLSEMPEVMIWPETEYVFVEKQGPFQVNAPQAWHAAHALADALRKRNRITGYLSLYKVHTQIYRAGFALDAPPVELPARLSYEHFKGGKYSRFVLKGPYSELPRATGRVFEIVTERAIEQRDDFCIEYYVTDPRTTAEENLITEILIPTA
jgi:predicted transcriptional regulator YdeE